MIFILAEDHLKHIKYSRNYERNAHQHWRDYCDIIMSIALFKLRKHVFVYIKATAVCGVGNSSVNRFVDVLERYVN